MPCHARPGRCCRCPTPPPDDDSAPRCSPGTAPRAATCPGAARAIRTTSSSPRSCCSRRRSTASCPSTTSGSRSTRRSRSSPRRPRTTWCRRGDRSATTSVRGACSPSRGRPSRDYDGQLPSDEATLLSFKGIGAYTAGAVMSFAFGKRAAILDTNVARVLFRVFVGEGEPKSHAMQKHLWESVARRAPAQARLRLQPGADGLRRDGLHGAQAAVPLLPDAEALRLSSPVPCSRRTPTISLAAGLCPAVQG